MRKKSSISQALCGSERYAKNMVKDVNPMIHVNERDFPVTDYHCDDPEKKKLVMKLALMITDNIPRKLPGGMKENHMDQRGSPLYAQL